MPDDFSGRVELPERLRTLEARLYDLEKVVWTADIKLKEGIASTKEVTDLKEKLRGLEAELEQLKMKTTRWEGGGSIIYIFITMIGAVIGWVLSHTGLGR